MRNIILTISLIVASLASNAQWEGQGVPVKWSPVLFKNSVIIGDTFAVDSGSPLKNYGQTLIVDTLTDGRAFFKSEPLRTAADTSYIKSVVSDTASQLRTELSDSSTLLKTSIADSARWVLEGSGASIIQANTALGVVVGQTAPVSEAEFYVNGVSASNIYSMTTDVDGLNLRNGNQYLITASGNSDDTIKNITSPVAGAFYTLTNISASPIVLSVGDLGVNGITLRLPAAALNYLAIPEYGMVTIWCRSTTEFWQYTTVIDND